MRRKRSSPGGPEEGRIWMWFEFYKLALQDPRYKSEIRKSKNYYAEWGRITPYDQFETWWQNNYMLFGDGVFEDHSQPVEGWLFVTVPLNQTEASIMKSFRELVRRRQHELSIQQGSPRKTKAGRATGIPLGLYDLTPGTEFRVDPAIEAWTLYVQFVHGRKKKPVINANFLAKVQKYYRRHKLRLPITLDTDPEGPNSLSAQRSLRRYLKRAEALIAAAAVGDFPGKPQKARS